jgi:hypothetical protein
MKIDGCMEIDVDCESGSLNMSAWAKDRVGNAAFMSIQTERDSGHVSFNLQQAKRFSEQLAHLVKEIEDAER